MAGHIILVSCLLAICLPIICVQLPRIDNVKRAHAEKDAEARPAILRRRSPSPQEEALRRSSRYQHKAGVKTAMAATSQKKDDLDKVSNVAAGSYKPTDAPESMIQGDACTDDVGSPREKPGVRVAGPDRKPWDPPFKRQPPSIRPGGQSPNGRCRVINVASTSGPDLEARGVAMRLFPPDSVSETSLVCKHDRPIARPAASHNFQESSHRRLAQENHMQTSGNEIEMSPQECQSEGLMARSIPSQFTGSNSLPSPCDGPPLPSAYQKPQNIQLATNIKSSCCHHRNCRQVSPNTSTPHSPNDSLIAPNNAPRSGPHKFPRPEGKATAKGSSDLEVKDKEAPKSSIKSYVRDFFPWKQLLILMGLLIFIFAFAILVAHCLAWFLVYKTEARLGEVRSGLLRGGEMRLCLCGKG